MSDPFDPAESVEYDSKTETYRGHFDGTAVAPSTTVVRVVAHVCGSEPTELSPLHDAIDPEALDRLCTKRPESRREGDCIVEFAYHGYRIRVKSYGLLEVEPLDAGVDDAGDGVADERN